MISRPTPNAIEVRAIAVPRLPMAATAPARAKFTPAPMKRLTEVQKANPVARASVPNCSGSHRLKIAKLPPNMPRKKHPAKPGRPEADDLLPVKRCVFPDRYCIGRDSACCAAGHLGFLPKNVLVFREETEMASGTAGGIAPDAIPIGKYTPLNRQQIVGFWAAWFGWMLLPRHVRRQLRDL